MEKQMFVSIYQPNENQTNVLGVTENKEQAFAIITDVLKNNPQVKTEQVFVEKFIYEKTLKIIDNK